jgi:carbamoyltransferase
VALGAAMLKCVEAGHKIAPLTHAYWGPEYSNDEIRNTLDKIGARYEVLDNPVACCVTDLAEQKTVGWFQGRMEFGPRALGNRSILADPRSAAMKDRINVSIKYREEFRPFCPSVLYECQDGYFKDTFDAPFMVVTFPVIDGAKDKIPAVVHVDGTARIQSVQANTNPLFTRLIGEFAKASSVPMLINTSLNINEQPMVNAPLEALHTYFCSGLDALYLGPYRLSKPS